ncbi:ABC transporter substrate-binding protein [Nocardioides piscis]|uniref:ABC transporter substrate-binding protein n=1 Tax=Nocardioides piscis TaxID=2714938 RepID=A0A6G7YH91_9ACTN|nr:ABC transporter substrate-binding protein [Nocardioides piscis]QIK76001.1 ABC transporter substrate-binding protein [Nocardioides piscis]
MRHTRTLLVVAAATTLGLTACAPGGGGDDAADEDGPIKVGIIADLTGATGDVGTPYAAGEEAYVDWLNDNGGIDGREIDATVTDYAYDVPTAERVYKEYVNDGVVAVMGWGTGDSEALKSRVSADELPFMSASYAEPLTDPEEAPYNFVVAPTYSDQARVGLNWIAEDGKSSEVALFHNDSPFGLAPVADAQEWAADLDLNVEPYPMPAGSTNYTGLLSQAKKQGAKYIMIQNVSSPAALVAKDIKAQGLDMQIVCLNWCADELFIDTAGAEAAEGHVLVQPFAPVSAEQPGHEDVNAYLEENGSSLEKEGLHFAQGWYTMHAMAEGIRAAVEEGDLSGAGIKEALETMGAIDTGGVVGAGEIEFSADSHRGSTGTGIYKVEGGEMAPVELGVTP